MFWLLYHILLKQPNKDIATLKKLGISKICNIPEGAKNTSPSKYPANCTLLKKDPNLKFLGRQMTLFWPGVMYLLIFGHFLLAYQYCPFDGVKTVIALCSAQQFLTLQVAFQVKYHLSFNTDQLPSWNRFKIFGKLNYPFEIWWTLLHTICGLLKKDGSR